MNHDSWLMTHGLSVLVFLLTSRVFVVEECNAADKWFASILELSFFKLFQSHLFCFPSPHRHLSAEPLHFPSISMHHLVSQRLTVSPRTKYNSDVLYVWLVRSYKVYDLYFQRNNRLVSKSKDRILKAIVYFQSKDHNLYVWPMYFYDPTCKARQSFSSFWFFSVCFKFDSVSRMSCCWQL